MACNPTWDRPAVITVVTLFQSFKGMSDGMESTEELDLATSQDLLTRCAVVWCGVVCCGVLWCAVVFSVGHMLCEDTGCFFYWSPLNLAKSQSLYEIPYFNFFYRILILVLGLSQI